MPAKLSVTKLSPEHELFDFECGSEPLNRLIRTHALQSQRSHSAQTYVALSDSRVIGFYTLVAGEIVFEDAPERLVKRIPRHPIPIVLLARLGVDENWQGKRLGAGLVVDALRRVLQAAEIIGICAIVVHAKDEDAKKIYQHLGFESFATQPFTLYRLLKDIRHMLESQP